MAKQRQIFDGDGSVGRGRIVSKSELERWPAATIERSRAGTPAPAARVRSSPAWILVAAATFAALALRLGGIGFMLPHLPHVDERVYLTQVETLRGERSTAFEWRNFRYYPHLVAELAVLAAPRAGRSGAPAVVEAADATPGDARPGGAAAEVIPGAAAGVAAGAAADAADPRTADEARADPAAARALDRDLARAAEPLRSLRILVALLSVALVPATWLLGRRLVGERPALLAAGLAATSVLGLWYAQQARPHAPAATLAAWTLVAALALRRSPTLGAYLLAGAAAGLALATLQSLVLVLPALVAAHLLRATGGTRRPALALGGALALAAGVAALFYPFAFEGPPAGEGREGDVYLYGHGIELGHFDGSSFARLLDPWRDYDPLLYGLVLLAGALLAARAVAALARRVRSRRVGPAAGRIGARARELAPSRADLWVVLAFVVPYALVVGTYARSFQRFALPLAAPVACLAAWAVFAAAARLAPRRPARAGAAAALLVLALQTTLAAAVVRVRAAPDTASVAAAWIARHLEPGADRIAVLPPLDLPLWRTPEARDAHYRRNGGRIDLWPRWQEEHDARAPGWNLATMPMHAEEDVALLARDPAAYLERLDADYAVFEVNEPRRRPAFHRLRDAAAARGELVASFSPWRGADRGDPILYYWDSEGSPERDLALRALAMERLGPRIEVYRLR